MSGMDTMKLFSADKLGIGVRFNREGILLNPVFQKISGLPVSNDFRYVSSEMLLAKKETRQLHDVLFNPEISGPPGEFHSALPIGSVLSNFDIHVCKCVFVQSELCVFIAFQTETDTNDLQSQQGNTSEDFHKILHDLKAPVRAMRNLTEWISDECRSIKTSDELDEYLELLRSSSVEINEKLESLRTWYRDLDGGCR